MDLSATVREMRSLLKALVAGASRLDLALDPQLPMVEADPKQIRQVMIDLATNAAEALSAEEGRIRISTGTMECDDVFLESAIVREGVEPGVCGG